jgi:hypothetical protein
MGTTPDPAALAEEQRRADALRLAVDVAAAVIRQGRLTRAEGAALVATIRRRALELFPDKEDVFDLVLAPRFARLLDEFARDRNLGRLLPFPPR